LKDGRTFGIKNLEFPSPGKPFFAIQLNWSRDDLDRLATEVRAAVSDRLDPKQYQFSLSTGSLGSLVGALLQFVFASEVGDHGFGPLGTIRIYNGERIPTDKLGYLLIGQYEAV